MSGESCAASECERPTWGHGDYCATHTKQIQRTGHTQPIAEKLTPEQRLLEACQSWVDSDPMDDAQYDARLRSLHRAAEAFTRKRDREKVRRAIASAKAGGARLGRPQKVTTTEVRRLFAQLKTGLEVAKALGVHPSTAGRHLARPTGPRPKR